MRAKRPIKPSTRFRRHVRWELEILPWGIAVGLLLGFAAELYWHGNMLWMTGSGIGGGLVGAVCDTALYFYRRHSQTSNQRHP